MICKMFIIVILLLVSSVTALTIENKNFGDIKSGEAKLSTIRITAQNHPGEYIISIQGDKNKWLESDLDVIELKKDIDFYLPITLNVPSSAKEGDYILHMHIESKESIIPGIDYKIKVNNELNFLVIKNISQSENNVLFTVKYFFFIIVVLIVSYLGIKNLKKINYAKTMNTNTIDDVFMALKNGYSTKEIVSMTTDYNQAEKIITYTDIINQELPRDKDVKKQIYALMFYINNDIKNNVSQENIIKKLSKKGWDKNLANNIFDKVFIFRKEFYR